MLHSIDESLSYARIAHSIARTYVVLYVVNTESGQFVKYAHSAEAKHEVVKHGKDFFAEARGSFVRSIHPDDRDPYLAAVSSENINDVLSVDASLIFNFRVNEDGVEKHYEIKATRIDEGNPVIVIGVNDISAHMERLVQYERARHNGHTFANILETLASDYLCIFYVNFLTGEYVEYDPSKDYSGVEQDKVGTDFFGAGWRNVLAMTHDEDRPAIASAFSRDSLRQELAKYPTFIVLSRMVVNGKVTFVNIKATRMTGDEHHIVIGISNVDDHIRRKEAHARALHAAQAIANRDSLTGVKSEHAFADAEALYDRKIASGHADEFAVVACDVNDLKVINDTQGHEAGDNYLRSACSLVCTCFKHSPVFRVGGDGFVAILSGADYKNQEALLRSINEQVENNLQNGEVVVAIGTANYRPASDHRFQPVLERAFVRMYDRKAWLKLHQPKA